MAEGVHPALDEVLDDFEVSDLDDEEDGADEEGGLVIVEEGPGPATRRWVRYVMPVMVEVDCDSDEITRVVTLPEEIREDRDDMGHFCVYDEKFVRRHSDWQPEVHALCVTEPRWESRFRAGPPLNWPPSRGWEEGFDLTEADDAYTETNPYADPT
ncbi:MAG: hypothetical protein WCF33_01155 [Pseudonocardiaceae bacterium]